MQPFQAIQIGQTMGHGLLQQVRAQLIKFLLLVLIKLEDLVAGSVLEKCGLGKIKINIYF